jgi:hypothetical protein
MKRVLLWLVLWIQVFASNDTGEEDLLDRYHDERVLKRYQETKSTTQHWKSSDPLPTKLSDIGFTKDFKIVYLALWTDGGSTGYLFQDSKGTFFGVCICGPSYFDGEKTVKVKFPTYFPGDVYPPKKGDRSAPVGSDAEKFLSSLFGRDQKKKGEQVSHSERP